MSQTLAAEQTKPATDCCIARHVDHAQQQSPDPFRPWHLLAAVSFRGGQ